MLPIPDILNVEEIARVRAIIGAGEWVDGNTTSGHQSALAKHNTQLPETSEAAAKAGGIILDALARSPAFVAATLPLKVYPPLFNRYAEGDAFGPHVDSAIRIRGGSDFRIRSDVSVTLFLSDPGDYEGGVLTVGERSAKGAAGSIIVYAAGELHHVTPVTRGCREAAFFWVQSMVRSAAERGLLFDLDRSVQQLTADRGADDAEVIRLTGVYHNLLRRWAEL